MRIRVTCVLAIVCALVLASCAPKPALDARWPRADSERTVSEPAHDVTWPLTGKRALDETSAATPAVVLAVDATPTIALPGLEWADLVFEVVAGNDSRRVALFQSALPPAAGPLRPVADADRTLAAAYAGTVRGGGGILADVASLAALPETSAAAPPPMTFASASAGTLARGAAVQGVRFSLASGVPAEWRYDKAAANYTRFVGGKQALGTGSAQLRATNVVVLWAVKPADWPSARLAGAGRASIFTGGRKVSGSWEATGGPPAFRDESGAQVPLQPGNTWVEVLDNGADIVVH